VSLPIIRLLRPRPAKLGTHRRADTVARAQRLGLLAPSPLKGPEDAAEGNLSLWTRPDDLVG
jgi:hypothetical protein